ncbi:hypothetical protein Q5H92_13065 [Hymenobacter sp. M29]|uniref:Uncharacterized protein n=1 Tax=Hymenobacter mellowenesis TaxID=3063995 RepID=A0ABT9AE72_9BACT|nr:hypothetical protein [Hymenobacter sp. M29]MDO7847296.1 hypothetical protein [Hymenobacter sp. M29]
MRLLTGLLVAFSVGLLACTPARYPPMDAIESYVTNRTADTLLVSVGYSSDSSLVAPADVPRQRQAQTADSLLLDSTVQRSPKRLFFYLAWYRRRWYWVYRYAPRDPTWCDAAGNLHAATVNDTTGEVTYQVMPGDTLQLAKYWSSSPPDDTDPLELPAIVSLRLRQGQARRSLPRGPELNQLFQAQFGFWQGWLEWGPTTYRYELRVGPGLTLNDD